MTNLIAFLEDHTLVTTTVAVVIAFIGWALATGVQAKAMRVIGWSIFAVPAGVILFHLSRLVRWGIDKAMLWMGP